MNQKIRDEAETYLLNANRDDYLRHVVSSFQITPLQFQFDDVSMTPEEMLVPAEIHPPEFNVYRGKNYPRLVLTYRLPFIGDADLLKMSPNVFGTWMPSIWIEGSTVCFEFIDFHQNAEATRREVDNVVTNLRQSVVRVNDELARFNQGLYAPAQQVFDHRKQQLLERKNYLQALNIPIRATGRTAQTYAAPAPRKIDPITPRPIVADREYRPEPTLEEGIYHQILKIIHDVGTSFEKLPSTYTGKDEETLRDHLLIALAPNFQGSTTGETFNKSGKTDILLRHEKSNLFVAECKFWQGQKVCLDTLTQLIKYLTWRDSKAAVIFFVRNQDFSEVLSTVKLTVPQHGNFLGDMKPSSETWFNYRFHVDGDRNREIRMAVLLFHFPPPARTA